MINLSIPEAWVEETAPANLENAALAVLAYEHVQAETDLTIALVTDAEIQELNNSYRASNTPTDVLSFNANEVDPETNVLYLGDIIISLERAYAQAQIAGHSVKDELSLLVVHGVLHLLGYDHASEEEKNAMWSKQWEILASLGIHIRKFSED